MIRLDESEIEFIKELDDSMVNPYDFSEDERQLVEKLVSLGYLSCQKTSGFNNYYYKLTDKGIKELLI